MINRADAGRVAHPILPAASTWKQQIRNAVQSLPVLLQQLGLNADQYPEALIADPEFALRVPRSFIARMQPGNPQDPLLLQILPRAAERIEVANFGLDPVADLQHSPHPGVIHKYQSRALLIAAATCAVNCRYCFRRSYPYRAGSITQTGLQQARTYLISRPEINELILSGGDPLVLDESKLARITDALLLPQIKRLRLHTRTPIVIPNRIDAGFLRWLAALPVKTVMVLHSNHAHEWRDQDLQVAMRELQRLGVVLLNQAVLLAGVNDSAAAQIALSEALFDAGVAPYYLNQLDRVAGSAHFEVSDARAVQILAAMQAALPGFLVPKLVRDVPGEASKQVLK